MKGLTCFTEASDSRVTRSRLDGAETQGQGDKRPYAVAAEVWTSELKQKVKLGKQGNMDMNKWKVAQGKGRGRQTERKRVR